MTIQEMNEIYPLIWVVKWATCTMYHAHEELFLTESEAKDYFNSIDNRLDKSIGRVHDIWGWSKKQKEASV